MDAVTVAGWVKTKETMEQDNKYTTEALKKYIDLRNKLIKACQQNGVPILLGSDAPQVFNVPGFSVHHELQYLVDAGLTPYQALQTGTANVGKFYNKNQGVIKTGAIADLVLLYGDPLKAIGETRKISGVMIKGRWLDKQWIDETLAKLKK